MKRSHGAADLAPYSKTVIDMRPLHASVGLNQQAQGMLATCLSPALLFP